mgnify:CR=1 FL=1
MGVTEIGEQISQLRQERRSLEDRLRKRGKRIPGAVIERYTECGKAGCRCPVTPDGRPGEKHGPYTFVTEPVAGKSRVTYVPKELRRHIEPQVRRYQEFQRALAEWRKVTKELDALFTALRESQAKDLREVLAELKGQEGARAGSSLLASPR